MNTAAQVFGDFVHALKCGARLFVGAMPCANATLSTVGAGALAIDAHAYRDKRNTDNSQNNNIDRCHSKPPLVNHYLLYPIFHLPKRDRFILVGFICGNATSYFWSKAICPPLRQKARVSLGHPGSWKGANPYSDLSGNCGGSSAGLVLVGPCMRRDRTEDLEEHRNQQHDGHNRPDTKLSQHKQVVELVDEQADHPSASYAPPGN